MSDAELERLLTKQVKATASEAVAKGMFSSESQAIRVFVALTNRVVTGGSMSVDEQGNAHIHRPPDNAASD